MDPIVSSQSDVFEPYIVLGRMPQQEEVRCAEDDWTGSTDAAERRKRQNRLHQRLYRGKRQREKKLNKATTQVINNPTVPDKDQFGQSLCLQNDGYDFLDSQERKRFALRRPSPAQVWYAVTKAESDISQRFMTGTPRADMLLTLIQFNVFRALIQNTFALGFDFAWLDGEAVSTFCTNEEKNHGPLALQPTALQRKVEHHPWIDLFPFPALRDNLLQQGEDYDDSELCYDLVELCNAPGERSGLIVWSEPWTQSSWEVTEEFASKWSWILKGCSELLESTNYWRRQRGENELAFDITPRKYEI